MPVRQALNTVYARVLKGADEKQRKEFIDSLYGFDDMNARGNDVLRDIRAIDEQVTTDGGSP